LISSCHSIINAAVDNAFEWPPNPRFGRFAQVHFREEHSEGSADFVASPESQILGVLPAFGQSSRQIVRRRNLALNGGSNAMWSLGPEITLRASYFTLFSQCHLLPIA